MTSARMVLPPRGSPAAEIEAALRARVPDDTHSHWSRAFRGPPEVESLARHIYSLLSTHNGLFSVRADFMREIEGEVIEMCVSLFHPSADATGTFTSGGSESNYSALHAMREWARSVRPTNQAPEVVAPQSAHPTFSKGCHYLGLKLVRVPLDANFRASPEAIEDAITERTIGLVGSAPSWSHGRYDPIERLGALAEKYKLWLHVDACVGGYLAPFAERLGYKLPRWDFQVPQVMSISADLHKLGYCPKPASTILWRSSECLRFHLVQPEDWPGGRYSTAGLLGSRPAGSIFAAWSVLRFLGQAGYERLAARLLDHKQQLIRRIQEIDGLTPFETDLLPVAFGSTDLDLRLVKAELTKLGWLLVATAEPPLIVIPLDPAAEGHVADTFISDLQLAVARARGGGVSGPEELRY